MTMGAAGLRGKSSEAETRTNQAAATFPLRAINIEFGIKDFEVKDWSGSVAVSKGEIVRLRGHHFKKEDELGANHSWLISSTPYTPQSYAGAVHLGEIPAPSPTRVTPVGVTVYYRTPDDAEFRVKTERGDFNFKLHDVPESEPIHLLGTQAEVFRVPAVEHLTTEDYDDDYPSVVVDDETVTVVWIGYRNEKDHVFLRSSNDESWLPTVTVTEQGGDLYGTAAAVDSEGRIWVVWSQRSATDWHLKGCSFQGASQSEVFTLTSGSGNNLFHRLVADSRGNLHLVWQSGRSGRFDIFYRSMINGSWSDEINLSDPQKQDRANDWNPDLAVDSKGTAWAAWDTYDGGSYNIRMRRIVNGQPGEIMRVTDTPRFHAHPSLAVDGQDRVWIAYDVAEENWGKDTGFLLTGGSGLYESRSIRVLVYDGSRWLEPLDRLDRVVRPVVNRYVQSPRLIRDSKDRMWVLFRPRTRTNRSDTLFSIVGKWEMMASYYAGDRWVEPVTIPESSGRNEGPLAGALGPGGAVYSAWVMDQRTWGGPQFGVPPGDSQVLFANVAEQFDGVAAVAQLGPRGAEPPARIPTEPREERQVAAIRDYTIRAQGRSYKIYRGDLHRHTDISQDGAGDGSLFDSYRYMIDAAAMDLYLVTGHNSGHDQEYSWWRIEKSEDMFHLPGFFVTLFGYERSLGYPNGHRNIIYSKRGNRPLGGTAEEARGSTGPFLYPHLRKTNGIATSHTSATTMGTDWRDNDPELEPIVEIFQGARTSAEHEGAPLAPTKERTDLWAGGYRPLGYVWRAWELGYKLGVQASSDHVSTHTSYAMVLAEDFSRDGLLDAMRQRHTYGATSNIVLDFQLRDGSTAYIQGDAYSSPNIPELAVNVLGTREIKQAVVIRDNNYIYTRAGAGETLQFTFKESSLDPGEHYYYVRVEQKDGNVAWSSPIWVQYR